MFASWSGSLSASVAVFLVATLTIGVAGALMSATADRLADRTGSSGDC